MAHDIGEMFYVGEKPWHGLGKKLARAATAIEALKEGGLDWTVEPVPLVTDETPPSPARTRVALVRSDRAPGDPRRVIGVVHRDFKPLQNRDGVMMFDRLLGRGERVYHTGGYLGDGQKIWLLARIPGDIVLNGDDVIEPYLLFSNSHDGSLAIDIRLTTIRVVCQNTLSMALHSRGPAQKPFRRAHQFDLSTLVQKAEDFLKFTLRQTEETKRLFEQLAKKACEPSSFESFLKALLPDPTKPEAIAPVTVLRSFESRLDKAVRTRAGILSVHNDGIKERKIPPAPETWWGALNSVTAWVDHLQETKSDRYAHALFGSGDRLKGIALNQILAKAGHASVPI